MYIIGLVLCVEHRDVNFAFSSMETENCFAGTCDGQSADFLRTAAINLVGARCVIVLYMMITASSVCMHLLKILDV